MDVSGCCNKKDAVKANKLEITQLNTKIRSAKQRKKATKAQMMDIRSDEEALVKLRKEHAAIVAEWFDFIVHARNTFVKTQLQEEIETYLPDGQILVIHCVSNNHYASWEGAPLAGPRLSIDATGNPLLRSYAFSLAAPGLLRTLDVYVGSDIQIFLKGLQLWTESTMIDRRSELLELVRIPVDKLGKLISARTTAYSKRISASMTKVLKAKNLEAVASALKMLDKKQQKNAGTVRAFMRKYGKYSTKVWPKECWYENLSKSISDTAVEQEEVLARAEVNLPRDLKKGVVSDLAELEAIFESMCCLLH